MEGFVRQRIKMLIDELDISVNAFSKMVDVSQRGLSSMFARETEPSQKTVAAIINNVPNLNPEWLLTGEGDMFKKSNKDYSTSNFSSKAIKYYPTVNGSMGGIQFLDNPDESFVDIIIPGFSDCEFAINAYGDSMYPVIKSGQVVLLMPWREKFIEWGRIYLVVTKSGYRTIKYIKPSKNNGCVLCESENKEESPAFEIEKDDILKMFLVKGWICKDAI